MRNCPALSQDDEHPLGGKPWEALLAFTGGARKTFTRSQDWRKSSQWVALVRSHAELVARERELLWELGYLYPATKQFKERMRCAWNTSQPVGLGCKALICCGRGWGPGHL